MSRVGWYSGKIILEIMCVYNVVIYENGLLQAYSLRFYRVIINNSPSVDN